MPSHSHPDHRSTESDYGRRNSWLALSGERKGGARQRREAGGTAMASPQTPTDSVVRRARVGKEGELLQLQNSIKQNCPSLG